MHAVTTSVDAELKALRRDRRIIKSTIWALPPNSLMREVRIERVRQLTLAIGDLKKVRQDELDTMKRTARMTAPRIATPKPIEPPPPAVRTNRPFGMTRATQPVARFFPEQPTHALPMPTPAREHREGEVVGYEVVWTPHRDAPSLIGSYTRKAASVCR